VLAESVKVIDPTHPFYGLTLPLLEISVKEPLGPVCVVRLRPNVKRLIPLTATHLGGVFPPASPCRLALAAASALLAVVASLSPFGQEDAHAQPTQARSPTTFRADAAPVDPAPGSLGSTRSAPVHHAHPTTPTPPAIPLTPQQVWATLPPAAQAQLRQTMLRILQEVVHGAPES
jgi:hypothetical protein